MSKIFIIATGPLLEKGVKFFSGQCLRTIHFLQPLLDAGHEVEMFLHPISDLDFKEGDALVNEVNYQDISYKKLNTNNTDLMLPLLNEAVEKYDPDAILGINPFPSYLACKLNTHKPIWCDLNGYAMVEGQTHAYVYDDDETIAHFHRQEFATIRRADKFSTVSERQKYALLGELSLVGRLNKYTFDYEFCVPVPNAANPYFANFKPMKKEPDDNHFRVFWCGGFNTWTDVDLLYAGLTQAMKVDENIQFVSTGGVIAGHDEKTYLRFQELVDAGEFNDRFKLMGWVETETVDFLLQQCDLGINIDSKNNETIFGARNRITTMLACGMPVLSTLGTEATYDLKKHDLGLFVEMGNADALAEKLVYAATHKDELSQLGLRGQEFALSEYSPARTIQACVEWMEDPKLSPDNAARVPSADPELPLTLSPTNPVENDLAMLEKYTLERLMVDHGDLRAIRKKPWFKLGKSVKKIVKGNKE